MRTKQCSLHHRAAFATSLHHHAVFTASCLHKPLACMFTHTVSEQPHETGNPILLQPPSESQRSHDVSPEVLAQLCLTRQQVEALGSGLVKLQQLVSRARLQQLHQQSHPQQSDIGQQAAAVSLLLTQLLSGGLVLDVSQQYVGAGGQVTGRIRRVARVAGEWWCCGRPVMMSQRLL